jgi:hypothetical protein
VSHLTHTYDTQKLKGRIKIYAYQTKEANKVEKSWTSYAHQNAANFILDLLFFSVVGQKKYSKVNHERKSKDKLTQRISNFSFNFMLFYFFGN